MQALQPIRGYRAARFSLHLLQTRKMSSAAPGNAASDAQIAEFREYLGSSVHILALLGAGLSAASGLPTFRGAGGMWKNHEATSLATPEAFQRDPGLVWQFYSYRRHMALAANPNPAHFALADLARRKKDFVTLSQNVDGLSQRANHPPAQLHLLHGNLFDIKCFNPRCNYLDRNNYADPICPALAVTSSDPQPSATDKTGSTAATALARAMAGSSAQNDTIPPSDLPHCPHCKTGLLRPAVVWFGESLPEDTLQQIDDWIEEAPKIDLMLVIGTAAKVYPAAGYISLARSKGARIAVINMDDSDLGATGSLRYGPGGDWMFLGDAGVLVPQLLGE